MHAPSSCSPSPCTQQGSAFCKPNSSRHPDPIAQHQLRAPSRAPAHPKDPSPPPATTTAFCKDVNDALTSHSELVSPHRVPAHPQGQAYASGFHKAENHSTAIPAARWKPELSYGAAAAPQQMAVSIRELCCLQLLRCSLERKQHGYGKAGSRDDPEHLRDNGAALSRSPSLQPPPGQGAAQGLRIYS